MTKKNAILKILAVSVICLAFSTTGVAADSKTKPNPKWGETVTITCYGAGSQGNYLVTLFSEVLSKRLGVRVRPTPCDTDVGKLLPIRTGEAAATLISAGTAYVASHGLADWEENKEGPQQLRLWFAGQKMTHGIITRANSGITTWENLRGKRVALAPGIFQLGVPALLAYGNLKMDDVVVRRASGYTAAIKMVMSGGADFTQASPFTPILMEFAVAPYGLRYLSMDCKDKEAWKRVAKIAPFLGYPVWAQTGTFGVGGPQCLAYYPWTFVTYPNVDEDLIYGMVKWMVEDRDLYKNASPPSTEEFTLDWTLDLEKPVYIPFHSGLIRYAKEKGKWTGSHEAWQAKALKEEKERFEGYKVK